MKEKYFDLFADIWKFMGQWYGSRDWKKILPAATELQEKYVDTTLDNFSKSLIISCLDEIERSDREEEKKRPGTVEKGKTEEPGSTQQNKSGGRTAWAQAVL